MNNSFPLREFATLSHNGRLIREAESILQSAVKGEHTYIYIENPDGTTIRLQDGFKIKDYEFIITNIK